MKLFSKIWRGIKVVIVELFFFICTYILGILLTVAVGELGKGGLALTYSAAFLIALFWRNFVWRRIIRKSKNRGIPLIGKKRALITLIIFFLVLETSLIFIIPKSVLLPDEWLIRMGAMYPLERATQCDLAGELAQIKTLWGDRIDYEKVHFVKGGAMHTLWILEKKGLIPHGHARVAQTIGNTIYLYDFPPCPTRDVYFHEMAHVWQKQHGQGHLFGFGAVTNALRMQYFQIFDKDVLYDYGGEEGLAHAKQDGKHFADFGTEQQAMIIEDWYWKSVGTKNQDGILFTPKYRELLDWYVAEMLEI